MSVPFSYILQTYGYWPFVLAFVAMALTFPLKLPYKALTGRIKTPAVGELLDRVILLFPVAIGIGLWYLHNYIFKIDETTIVSVMAGAATGGLAIVYYNLFGRYIERAILRRLGKQPIDDTPATSEDALDLANAIALGDKTLKEAATDAIGNDDYHLAAFSADNAPVGNETQQSDEEAEEEDSDEDEEENAEDEIDDTIYDLAEQTGLDYDTLRAVIDRMRRGG